MELLDKLAILADAAKYDAACTSSGVRRGSRPGMIGNTSSSLAGCCHSFSADGRCITLLKVLMTNRCVYDCKYCVNRRSHDTRRAAFTPRELAELTIGFYRRNYIEGLFLSSGVLRSPDYTTEQMIECRQSHPRHVPGAGAAAGPAGGPAQRQYRASLPGGAADPGPGQKQAGHPAAYGPHPGPGRPEQGGVGAV